MKVKTHMAQEGILPRGFTERVRRIVGDEHFSQQEGDLISYSLDYWLYGVFLSQRDDLPALPSAVVSPASTAQIQEIVRCASEYKVPITPFGGGSGVLGGAIPLNGSIVLNLQRMSSFRGLDEFSLVAEFEGGIIGANLELELNHRGYSAGNIPQSLFCSTLGGWISARAAGQFSTKYGKIEDMVLGMEVVLPDGELLNIRPVPRRSVGPSLKDLFLGGEGALGIVTKATISVHPLPRLTIKQSFIFPSIEVAGDVGYFISCSSYKDQDLLKATEKLLSKSGLAIRRFGGGDICCGAPLYYAGDMEGFSQASLKMKAEIKTRQVRRLVVDCPTCIKMMTKTYREIGAELPVEIMHTTQFIEALLKQGKLNFRKKNKIVTFHDPCILSYDLAMSGVAREIITALGFDLKEPVYSGEHTHCCGGAYGAKIGDHRLKDAVTSMRVNELKNTAADIYVTACPTCKSVLSEINMRYITELVAENIIAER
jgi:heterodisulfide reductase subunit B